MIILTILRIPSSEKVTRKINHDFLNLAFQALENRHPPDNKTLSSLYPTKKGVIYSYPTHKRLITKSYPNSIHICCQGGADSLIQTISVQAILYNYKQSKTISGCVSFTTLLVYIQSNIKTLTEFKEGLEVFKSISDILDTSRVVK